MDTSPEQSSDVIDPQPQGPTVSSIATQSTSAPHPTQLGNAVAALPPTMHQAFKLTTQGVPAKTIAEEIGIARSTLFHWKKYNPKFRAAIDAWHQDQVQSTQLAMVAMLPEAVEKVRKEMKYDANLAFKVIDKCGGFAPPPTGSISPRQMRKQIKLELRREKLRARKRQEKLHMQEVNQRAQELEDKLEADRVEKLRKMDPAEVNRIRDYNARIERLAAELREARKRDPDYKLDENYVRAVLNPEEFQEKAVVEKSQQRPEQQQQQLHPTDVEDDLDDDDEEEEEDFDEEDDDDNEDE